jgi:cysteinyl-tRNA synthetase
VGFDGVYLDWVEAYSDEQVAAQAEAEGLDPVQEMVCFVGDIASFGRAQNPDFLVIAQNAAELAKRDDYVAIIDAIAQEQVWFDGGADNETDNYVNSLSPECRRQHDEFPESTLHVSSEEYCKRRIYRRWISCVQMV